MKKKNSQAKKVMKLNVTRKMREKMKARGIDEEAIPSEGKHQFSRVPAEKIAKRNESKVKITIQLDADVLHYFRKREEMPNAMPYQTQINNELRRIMEAEQQNDLSETARTLLKDKKFISELKKLVA